jgi:branched-chain amino acid transport system substrate-binding protein
MTVRRSLRRRSPRHSLALLIVPVLALGAACTGGGDDTPAAGSGQTLKIGLLAPLTGPDGTAGVEAQRGAQLAADVINGLNPSIPLPLAAEAGLPNLGGAKVSVVPANTTPKADLVNGAQVIAGTAVTKLVSDDGVQALIGAYDPQVTEYASQRSERYEIPFVNADSPATFLTEAGRDWFFRIGPTWRSSGEAFFSLLQAQKVGQGANAGDGQNASRGKIDVLYANDKAGQDVVTTIKELAAEAGLPEPTTHSFAEDGSDIGAQVGLVKQDNPATLFLYATPATVQPLLQAFTALQFKPKAAMSFSLGYLSADAFDSQAATADGLLRSVSWSIEAADRNPAARAVTALYQRRFNSQMTEAAASAFTAVMTVAQAANNAGTTDNQRMRSALLSLNVPGEQTIMPWAGIQFDETHQNVLAQTLIEQYINKEIKIVYPSDAAARGATVTYPAPNSFGG